MPTSYTIGKHYEAFIRKLLDSGRYSTASEVMREGLRLVEEREEQRQLRLEALRADIQRGFESGPSQPFEIKQIVTEAKRRKAAHGRGK